MYKRCPIAVLRQFRLASIIISESVYGELLNICFGLAQHTTLVKKELDVSFPCIRCAQECASVYITLTDHIAQRISNLLL